MKKLFIKILSILFPDQMTRFAYRQLTNPQIRKLRENEMETLDKADKNVFRFKGFDIQTYQWTAGAEKILLIHGWEGQAGNFATLIRRLLDENYTVYAFDGPSHGFSSKGATSLFEFTELVGILIRKWDVTKLVSHSFGGVATTYALYTNPDLKVDRYVLLTAPDTFSERIDIVSAAVGITGKVKSKLIQRFEMETSMKINDMAVSEWVKKVNVEHALIIHDKNDNVIPVDQARNVSKNWMGAELLEIEGTGHFKILGTQSVLDTTIGFLKTAKSGL
jgi:pimeloyl-ACP methyl ester carboxylesterase